MPADHHYCVRRLPAHADFLRQLCLPLCSQGDVYITLVSGCSADAWSSSQHHACPVQITTVKLTVHEIYGTEVSTHTSPFIMQVIPLHQAMPMLVIAHAATLHALPMAASLTWMQRIHRWHGLS